jgi:putative phage-type endonuclease
MGESDKKFNEDRRKGIGGTDIGAIAGLNENKSEFRVYQEKTGKIKPNKVQTEKMYWGERLEPILAEEAVKRLRDEQNISVELINPDETLVHPQYEFMRGNLDREIVFRDGTRGVLECSTTGEFFKTEWKEDELPAHFLLQVQWYLMLTGYDIGYIAVLIGGNNFVYKRIDANLEIQEHLKNIATTFWGKLQRGEEPEPDGSKDAEDAIRELYPVSTPEKMVDLSYMESEYKELLEILDQVETLTKIREAKKQKIKNAMKDSEIAKIGKYTVTLKSYISNRFDTTKFKQDEPEMYNKYLKEISIRRFNMK